MYATSYLTQAANLRLQCFFVQLESIISMWYQPIYSGLRRLNEVQVIIQALIPMSTANAVLTGCFMFTIGNVTKHNWAIVFERLILENIH